MELSTSKHRYKLRQLTSLLHYFCHLVNLSENILMNTHSYKVTKFIAHKSAKSKLPVDMQLLTSLQIANDLLPLQSQMSTRVT